MRRYIILFISLGFVLAVNIYFRSFPINFPQLKEQAASIVEQRTYQKASQHIDKNFPKFSNLTKEILLNTLISDYRRQNKVEIKKQIQEEYFKLKDRFQDVTGQTYLMELDCWHWARYTENVYRLGHPGDKIINGRQLDSLMLAPSGSYLPWERFLFYSSAFLYKIFSLIKTVPLFTFVFYLPLFFITIFIVVLYLFCFYRWGNICAIISCLFVGLAPIFLYRSCAGWFDKDIFALLFPLLIIWTYLMSYESKALRARLFWIFISGFWIGMFCYTWLQWWFIFLIIITYEIYSFANLVFAYLQYKEKHFALFKQHLFSLFLFLVFSFFWIILFSGLEPIAYLYTQTKGALFLNKPLISSIWPNVYSTVGEFRKPDYLQILNSVGGTFLFVSSLICLLILFLRNALQRKILGFKSESVVILTVWFIAMFLASNIGIRFTMFILIPLGISFGAVINEAYEFSINKNKKWMVILLAAIMIISVSSLINSAYKKAKDMFPLMNDVWYRTLIAMKDTTPQNAVINSWWDFGDWFKVVSKRGVIFDGQSQNSPQAYWIAKVLLTDNEEEAIGILRMLNNGGNSAFEIINEYLKDPLESVLLLKKIILVERKQAEETLKKVLPSSAADKVIALLFNKPEKAYFIVEYTMLSKMRAISFLGNWNFTKAYLAQNLNRKDKRQIIDKLVKLGIDEKEAEELHKEVALLSKEDLDYWVSDKFEFYTLLVKGQEKTDIVLFDNGLVYKPKEQAIYLYSPGDNKYKIPKSLFIFNQDKIEEIAYPDSELDFSALIIKDQEDYRAIILKRELGNSLFSRLYFLDGATLKHFKPFLEEKDKDGYIRVFEIIWD